MGRIVAPDTATEIRRSLPRPTLTAALCLGLAAFAFGALAIGPYGLTPAETLAALAGRDDPQTAIVVWSIRVPRVGAALLVGVSLAAAGASYQALFRNPLVSPNIVGVSAGRGSVPLSASFCRCRWR